MEKKHFSIFRQEYYSQTSVTTDAINTTKHYMIYIRIIAYSRFYSTCSLAYVYSVALTRSIFAWDIVQTQISQSVL